MHTDKIIPHFAIKKPKSMQAERSDKDYIKRILNSMTIKDVHLREKVETLFGGNMLFVFLGPFDFQAPTQVFNPSVIVRADRTYGFMSIQIKDTQKLGDLEVKYY